MLLDYEILIFSYSHDGVSAAGQHHAEGGAEQGADGVPGHHGAAAARRGQAGAGRQSRGADLRQDDAQDADGARGLRADPEEERDGQHAAQPGEGAGQREEQRPHLRLLHQADIRNNQETGE